MARLFFRMQILLCIASLSACSTPIAIGVIGSTAVASAKLGEDFNRDFNDFYFPHRNHAPIERADIDILKELENYSAGLDEYLPKNTGNLFPCASDMRIDFSLEVWPSCPPTAREIAEKTQEGSVFLLSDETNLKVAPSLLR